MKSKRYTQTTQRQAYVLLLLGAICLVIAWLVPLNPFSFPIGVLFLGLGTLLAAFFYPDRLLIPGCLVTGIGLAVFLVFKHLIPGNQTLAAYILGIGLGLLALVPAMKRGYVGPAALSPAILVLLIGLIEVFLAAGLTPGGFIPFMISFWLPGLGLLLLGVIYFLRSSLSRGK
jgi:hypothetical protein